MPNSPEIKKLISKNANLFWTVPEEKKQDISLDLLVETLLNYGDIESIKELFAIIGIKKVSEIFFKQINRERCNYYPQTKHYFNLYFIKHV